MATKVLTPDQRELLERLLHERTLSFRAVARRTGLSDNYVLRYARRLGLTPPVRPTSPNLLKAIALVRDHGWSYKQASVACNLNFSTVRAACLSRNIPSPYPKYGNKQARQDNQRRMLEPQPPVEVG